MSNTLDHFPELLSGAEARKLTGMTPTIWMELFETGRLPKPVRVGGRLKWRKADVMRWIRDMQSVDLFAEESR